MKTPLATNGRELSPNYKIWFCDIWGVVHDGRNAYQPTCDALIKHRNSGGIVIFITNSPRPTHAILPQLRTVGVDPQCYDAIVTSGDVTRKLLMQFKGKKLFHIGPQRDKPLIEGLPLEIVDEQHADAVLCSGLYNDHEEQPEDYDEMLARLFARNLKMICANPDKVVQYGDQLLPCGGALAERYENLGGEVEMAGKPFAPIYDICMQKAKEVAGQDIDKSQVTVLGDGLATDIKGARNNDFAAVFVNGGIHSDDDHDGSAQKIAAIAEKAVKGVKIVGAMTRFEW